MSQVVQSRRAVALDLAKRKAEGRKIIALTAYHAHTASILDPHCDFILVGDSLGMVMHGMESTLPVTAPRSSGWSRPGRRSASPPAP